MKQKIVIEVQVKSEKCRRKALKIAVVEPGVSSVSLEGADRNEVVVIGECVDSVCLANALRKKFHHAKIQRVEEVKDKDKDKEETKPKEVQLSLPLPLPPYYYPPPSCVVCDEHQSCIIM